MSITTKVKSLAARASMSQDDVRHLLEKDHEEALAVAKQICDATQAARRAALFAKLKPALAAHSRAEEQVVYNALLALKRAQDSHDIANEGFVEHSLLDELLAGLQTTNASTDAWKAKAKVLKELLEHHVEEEQSDMFADLGDHFSSAELITMGQRFTQAKERILARKLGQRVAKAAKKPAKKKLKTAVVSKRGRRNP